MSKSLVSFNNDQRLASWAERIAACRNSGVSVKRWCAEQKIPITTYYHYHWQRKVFDAANRSITTSVKSVQFSELHCPPPAAAIAGDEPVAAIITADITAKLYPGVSPALAEAICRGLTHA